MFVIETNKGNDRIKGIYFMTDPLLVEIARSNNGLTPERVLEILEERHGVWTGASIWCELAPEELAAKAALWLEELDSISRVAFDEGVLFQSGMISQCIVRDLRERCRSLEPGCAIRLLRCATNVRSQNAPLAQRAYELAKTLARLECDPDPTWETMCEELGWTP